LTSFDFHRSTSQPDIDAALIILQENKDSWANLDIRERIFILDEILAAMIPLSERWVASGLAAKSLSTGTQGEAEEWLYLAVILRSVRLLRQTLVDIQRAGIPRRVGSVACNSRGQAVAHVFPQTYSDWLLYRGISAQVWMEPGISIRDVSENQALFYRQRPQTGKVALVLGAGNVSMIPVIDVLHKLFFEGQVVVLKPNPVNDYLGPLMEEGLQGLIRQGFLRIVYGSAREGSYLCNHPAVDELHMTGSLETFEAITFGQAPEGARRKRLREPILQKRFTCELGNISPVIIVPGLWRLRDVQDQAEQIVTWFVANAGFGCLTPRMLIQHRDWPLRQELVDAIVNCLGQVPLRQANYPGAAEIHASFIAQHPQARQIGQTKPGELPWSFIPGVDASDRQDICFTCEPFCSLFSETAIPAANIPDFIDQAVEFANTTLWGTLAATLIVHPASLRDPGIAAAVDRAVADLHYGTITVNVSPFTGYYLQLTPWGGFPGSYIWDIQSGIGKTANTLMFERVQKSVVHGPFTKLFDSIRITSKKSAEFCRKLAYYEASPSSVRLSSLAWTSLIGQVSLERRPDDH
jgi:hypothetical protein